MPDEIVKVVEPMELLSPEERRAYKIYMRRNDPPLAASIQAQLYELFLNGSSCEEIARLNPNFHLGMIVRARIEGLWDQRKEAYLAQLFEGVRERVKQVQVESVMFVADILTAHNKVIGDKLKRFLQTRDMKDFPAVEMKGYKEAAELLLKLTGQANKVEVSGQTKTTVEVTGPLSPKEAAAILKLADKEN